MTILVLPFCLCSTMLRPNAPVVYIIATAFSRCNRSKLCSTLLRPCEDCSFSRPGTICFNTTPITTDTFLLVPDILLPDFCLCGTMLRPNAPVVYINATAFRRCNRSKLCSTLLRPCEDCSFSRPGTICFNTTPITTDTFLLVPDILLPDFCLCGTMLRPNAPVVYINATAFRRCNRSKLCSTLLRPCEDCSFSRPGTICFNTTLIPTDTFLLVPDILFQTWYDLRHYPNCNIHITHYRPTYFIGPTGFQTW